MPRPKAAFTPAEHDDEPSAVKYIDVPMPDQLPPPGPLHCAFRVGEGGGKIMWAQRAYAYTIDPQDNQVIITVSLRPAQ